MAERKRVVIVGGGFAGLAVARSLARAPVDITLIDRSNHHLFQPLLYQVAMGGLSPSEIASPIRQVLHRQKNVVSWMAEVTGIDTAAKELELDDGVQRVPYDVLVLAAGGKTSYFGHNDWEKVAPGLKTVQDALTIRQKVLLAFERAERCADPHLRDELMTLVVIGGGPTGVELAGGLAELTRVVLVRDFRNIQPRHARIVLVEGAPRLLSAMDEKLSAYTLKRLQAMGVEVVLGERVTELHDDHVKTDKREIRAATIIWGAGVQASPLGKMLGAETDRGGRVIVDADLRVKGMPDVYCLGDLANYTHPHTFDGKTLPGLAPVAMQQGRWAARNIVAQVKGQPTKPFEYFDKGTMATIGRSSAVAHSGPFKFTGLLAWLAWLFIHVLYLVDFQNRVFVMLRWFWAYITWKWNARLITQLDQVRPYPDAVQSEVDQKLQGHPDKEMSNPPTVEATAATKSDS